MKFKVGDKVKVAKKVERNDKGNSCVWNVAGEMNKTIGKIGRISMVDSDGTVFVQLKNGNSWYYLSECLKLIERGKPTRKFKLNASYTAIIDLTPKP